VTAGSNLWLMTTEPAIDIGVLCRSHPCGQRQLLEDFGEEQLRLHRNFIAYTTHADCDLVALGAGAISHIGSSLSQNHPEISGWEAALAQNQLPVARGLELG